MATSERPNILVVMADQLAARALSAYGNQVCKTPHIDQLAEQGVVFENAYANTALCAPARFGFMTGQLASKTGGYDNACEFKAGLPTFAHYLRASGYRCCLSGKMHFVGPDQLHGFEERLTTDIYPADFAWTPNWEKPNERIDWWYHNMMPIKEAGVAEITNQLRYDDEVASQAEQWLYDYGASERDQPFCLVASFTHPHDPYVCRSEHYNRYDPADIDMPTIPTMARDDLDDFGQRLFDVSDMGRLEISDEEIRRARHCYYANVSLIDDQVGALLDQLKRLDLYDNTVVMIIADHGDMLGERGLWYKYHYYDWSAQVPMIIHCPQRFAPARRHAPTQLVDVLPTLCAIGDVDEGNLIKDDLAGDNLMPLLMGEDTSFDDRLVVGEYLGEGCKEPLFMLRQGPWKFIYAEHDRPLLFHMDDDPNEVNNLAGDPAQSKRVEGFIAEIHHRYDLKALKADVIANQRTRRLINGALTQGKENAWDFQPHVDASQSYVRNNRDLAELDRKSRYPRL